MWLLLCHDARGKLLLPTLPLKTDIYSLALQGTVRGALAQGMEMRLGRQVGGRRGPWCGVQAGGLGKAEVWEGAQGGEQGMEEETHRLSEAGRVTFQPLLRWCLSGPGLCLAKGMETECGAESLPRTCSRQETEGAEGRREGRTSQSWEVAVSGEAGGGEE